MPEGGVYWFTLRVGCQRMEYIGLTLGQACQRVEYIDLP